MTYIVCVSSAFPTNLKYWRGTFVENFCEALLSVGVKVVVVVPDSFQNIIIERVAVSLGIRNQRKSRCQIVYAGFFSLSRFAFWFSCLGRINRFLQEKAVSNSLQNLTVGAKPDFVYAHFLGNGFSASRWCKMNNVPLVVVSGESSYEHFYTGLNSKGSLNCLRQLHHLFFVSEKNKKAFAEYFGEVCSSTSILPNAVDTKKFHPGNKSELRKELGLPQDAKIIAFVGYFIERKGPKRVLSAIENLDNVFGVFIGKGSQVPSGPRVLYANTVENGLIPKWLGACDVFVLPSLNEGRSNAIIEALACGLPVVVADRVFNREFLTEDCAVFVDPVDPVAIRKAIEYILDSPERLERMKNAALSLASIFDIKVRARLFLDKINLPNG